MPHFPPGLGYTSSVHGKLDDGAQQVKQVIGTPGEDDEFEEPPTRFACSPSGCHMMLSMGTWQLKRGTSTVSQNDPDYLEQVHIVLKTTDGETASNADRGHHHGHWGVPAGADPKRSC
eukprot:2653959-Pyramimonas_sp.AAC.1